MQPRKIVLLLVCVNMSLVLILATSTRAAKAIALPFSQKSSARIIQPAPSRIVSYASTPAYDSGWESIGVRPDPISDSVHPQPGRRSRYLPCDPGMSDNTALGTYDCKNNNFNVQAHWYGLTGTTVNVYVSGGSQPDSVRVRIFTDTPAYDSGWDSISSRPDPISVEFTHDLGGNPDTYHVSLECRDNTTLGTYDCTNNNFYTQAHWYSLTDSTVRAYVSGGSQPDGVRVRIFTDIPAYDSGWASISVRPDPIVVPFTHNLGGDPDTYRVSLECSDDTSLSTYDCTNSNFLTRRTGMA